jgi:hypothetical protein
VSSPTRWERQLLSGALLSVWAFAGCSSNSDSVCEDIGDCAQGGSSSWITSCQSEADLLQEQANASGCGNAFTAYYSCANSHYACNGATPSFPGCDSQLGALDTCLAAITAGSYCTQLTAAEAACASAALDSGSGSDSGKGEDAGASGTPVLGDAGPIPPPPACNLARDCLAQCYLANVGDVCAPAVNELQASDICAATCPP